jgi:hypothetical protein
VESYPDKTKEMMAIDAALPPSTPVTMHAATAATAAAAAAAQQQRQPPAAFDGGDPLLLDAAGQHCAHCRALDFLPIICDACQSSYCADCAGYEKHSCPLRHTKSRIAAVCPLCQEVVPVRPGGTNDSAVEWHINRGCRTEKGGGGGGGDKQQQQQQQQQQHQHPNQCSFGKCKTRDLVACICRNCDRNFCLAHRGPNMHACTAPNKRQGGGLFGRITAADLKRCQRPDVAARTDGLLELLAAQYQTVKYRSSCTAVAEVAPLYSQVSRRR